MKSLVFVAKGHAAIIEEEMPLLHDYGMLLQTLYSGLSNGTERSFLMEGSYGYDLPYPKRIAYQHVSKVVECGAKITRFQAGDLVFSSTFAGHVEYLTVKETDLIVKLNDQDDLINAALLGVAAVAFHNVRLTEVTPTDHVLVVGDGLIGQFVAQCARVRGARVTLSGHHEDRLGIARSLGVDAAVNTARHGMQQVNSYAPFSVVFECSGSDNLTEVLDLVSPRARIALVGGRFDVRYPFNKAGRAEITIQHSQHFDQFDLEQVLQLVRQDEVRTRPLLRAVVPLDESISVFDTLRDSPSKLLGTVFLVSREEWVRDRSEIS